VNRRILVVHAAPHVSRLIRLKLETAGYAVDAVRDVETSWELARRSPPALVVSDYRLPSGNGLDLCRRLREHPSTRTVPVVMVTNLREELADVDLRDHGVACVFDQPFSPGELLETVQSILAGEWSPVPRPHLECMSNAPLPQTPCRVD
jgi:DNA-binding response OmpR family regulator